MASRIDFYLDFVSPFTYLALQKLPALARRYGRDVNYIPVDLAALKLLAGNTAPPTRTMPIKLKYMRLEQQRWAKRYGVPIAVPASYDSAKLNGGVFYAIDRGLAEKYVVQAFHRIWGLGGNMVDDGLLADLARHCGWPVAEFLDYIGSEEAKQRLQDATQGAHNAGVFGVPTMITDGDIWWGNDRLDFLDEHLSESITKMLNT